MPKMIHATRNFKSKLSKKVEMPAGYCIGVRVVPAGNKNPPTPLWR